MSDETTLLPCPFCGGEVELKEYKPNVSGVAICKECGARSPICKNDHTGGWKSKAIAVWNTRAELGNGTLTAEQVRETVLKHGNVMGPRFYGDWQAIANELNAELGSGTCEWLPVESCHAFAGPGWECSNCGYEVGEYEHDFYNCCPICCAKVMDE